MAQGYSQISNSALLFFFMNLGDFTTLLWCRELLTEITQFCKTGSKPCILCVLNQQLGS